MRDGLRGLQDGETVNLGIPKSGNKLLGGFDDDEFNCWAAHLAQLRERLFQGGDQPLKLGRVSEELSAVRARGELEVMELIDRELMGGAAFGAGDPHAGQLTDPDANELLHDGHPRIVAGRRLRVKQRRKIRGGCAASSGGRGLCLCRPDLAVSGSPPGHRSQRSGV